MKHHEKESATVIEMCTGRPSKQRKLDDDDDFRIKCLTIFPDISRRICLATIDTISHFWEKLT